MTSRGFTVIKAAGMVLLMVAFFLPLGSRVAFSVGATGALTKIGDYKPNEGQACPQLNYARSDFNVETYIPFSAPTSVAVGDFNGDGEQDLAVANAYAGVSILLGTGTGSFGAATNFGVGTDPYSVAVGDFNGDGKQDLVAANYGSNNVSILLGTGTGSFGAATNFSVANHPLSVAVGDFNGDGKQDLATANAGSNNVSILLGTGTGSFGVATNFDVGVDPRSIAVGDFNSDGQRDLATANRSSRTVSILLGTGMGSFGPATDFSLGNNLQNIQPSSVAVGDFNGDGKQDLAVSNYGSYDVSILLGTGMGSFGAATIFMVGGSPRSVAVGDFNRDGQQDIAVANGDTNSVSILLGTGTGSFGPATNFGVGTNPYSVAVGDFNGDGIRDLVTANSASRNVSVLLGQFTFTLDRDHQSFTGDGGTGTVNVTASDGCDWTANTTATFIHITSGSSGAGNGAVLYSVDSNSGSTICSGTITIAGHTFTVYQGINFADVPSTNPFCIEIGKLSARGVTVGCGGGNYCPNDLVTREQMAAFILRAKGEFDPPTPTSQRFQDVPPGNVFYNFIDRLAVLQITLGCTPDHLMYCPSDPVKREQMAAFLLRGLGEFDPPTPPSQRFSDVPPSNVFYKFIDRLAVLQITLGCTPDHLMYCPNDSVTRAQMAAFLVRAFDL